MAVSTHMVTKDTLRVHLVAAELEAAIAASQQSYELDEHLTQWRANVEIKLVVEAKWASSQTTRLASPILWKRVQ